MPRGTNIAKARRFVDIAVTNKAARYIDINDSHSILIAGLKKDNVAPENKTMTNAEGIK